MLTAVIILLAAILLAILLYSDKAENPRLHLIIKAALSALFVLTVLVRPHPISRYYHFMWVGLVLCWAGDVFLALPQKRMFLCSLVSFLFGHIFYIFGFFYVARLSLSTGSGALTVIVISCWVYFWLRPHLGAMKTPVLLYIIVISIMLCGAWSVLGDDNLARSGRIMVFAGALAFYFSDLFVARDRFLTEQFLNRLIALPMYYTGQFLLAFSVALLKEASLT